MALLEVNRTYQLAQDTIASHVPATIEDPVLKLGTRFRIMERSEWSPYSEQLTKNDLDPHFYVIQLEDIPDAKKYRVQAHVLENNAVSV